MPFPEVFTWIFDIWTSAIKYTIEVHDNTGDLIAVLENAHNIPYVETINEAPTLKFDIPADDDKEAYIIKANEIWLMNMDPNTSTPGTPTVVKKFRMSRRIDGRDREGKIITTVECDGLISSLADEQHVVDYSATSQTPTQIVTQLLALQVLAPAITIGTISPGGTYTMTASTGDTLLRTLFKLRDMVGGYIYVDNDRVLQWATSIGEDKGQQVRYQKNLIGVKRTIDYTTIGNRIYAFGSGSGDARIALTAPGYVEDAASQAAWGGIYVKVLVDRTFTDATALLAWANERLADIKDPLVTYTIDTSDLSESTEAGLSWEVIELGSTVDVIDEDLGLDVSVHVVRIIHPDLLHPQNVQMEITTLDASNPKVRTRDILDVITDSEESIDVSEKLPPSPTVLSSVTFIINGGGSAITTGVKGYIPLPFSGEIVSAELEADQSGNVVIDIWRDTFANFPPTVADTITAAAKPTLAAADSVLDDTLTGWTTAFTVGDILAFNVDSVATIEFLTITLKVRRT